MVHHKRFEESRQRGEPAESVLKHAEAAEQHYHQALALCPTAARQRDLLHRAQAFAQAALRDFQHYQGGAAKDEANTQQLLAAIAQALTKLPS